MATKQQLIGRIGAAAAALVIATAATFEGRVHVPYNDLGGVVTVCDGHTGRDIEKRKYTDEECDNLLASDLYKHDVDIARCITVGLEPHERAAFLDFALNAGATNFCRSTMLKKINAGDMAGACREFDRWTFIGGRDCKDPDNKCGGIVRRRAYERALCEGKQK